MNDLALSPSPLLILTCIMAARISPLYAQQVEYTADGLPTAREEEIRWHLNRARFDRVGENAARGTNYTDVPVTAGPLAPNESLTRAARRHTEDMAVRNIFQHRTVPGSAYYNPETQTEPQDRMQAEGYTNFLTTAEALTAGTNRTTGESAYLSWWTSTQGHRAGMCTAELREAGNGYYYRAASTLDHYYTMDMGAMRGSAFFTDTLFNDADGDKKYDQREGVGGVRVSVRVLGLEHASFDVSAAAGSFAIPTGIIPTGSTMEVWLTNQNPAAVSVHIPRSYATFEKMTLAPAENRAAGAVVQSAEGISFGFRNLVPVVPPIVPPLVTLVREGNTVRLSWLSEPGLQYLPQRSSDLGAWVNLGSGYSNGTGSVMTQSETVTASTPHRFYRLAIRRP